MDLTIHVRFLHITSVLNTYKLNVFHISIAEQNSGLFSIGIFSCFKMNFNIKFVVRFVGSVIVILFHFAFRNFFVWLCVTEIVQFSSLREYIIYMYLYIHVYCVNCNTILLNTNDLVMDILSTYFYCHGSGYFSSSLSFSTI